VSLFLPAGFHPGGDFGIIFIQAVRADAMGKIGVGMRLNIAFNVISVAFIVADFFTMGADRQEAAERLDLVEGFPKLAD
jgi:hypothetical protein